MYSRFSVAVVLSLLLHLLLLLALYQQDVAAPVLTPAKAAPLTVQIISRPQHRAKAEKPAIIAPRESATTTTPPVAEKKPKVNQPQNIVNTATQQRKNAATKAATLTTASSATTKPAPVAAEPTTKTIAEPDADLGIANRILNSVATKQQQQAGQLSSEEIQALWQKPGESKTINVMRSGPKPAEAADNVLEVLADGSFIEKIGNYCYQADAGADLRRDISSMKPVPCGKNANEVLYDSIMNKIGK